MAHSMLKPYSLLLYLLSSINFFFLGIIYAGIVDAGKGQMLAGGAIVLGYGVIAAFIGLIFALFIAYKFNKKHIVYTNVTLTIIMALSFIFFTVKYKKREQNKQQEKEQFKKPSTTVTKSTAAMLNNFNTKTSVKKKSNLGLGMFSSKLFGNSVLHSYSNINIEKSVLEHTSTDSITFSKNEYVLFDITTVPPWLVST
jgi:uncharacterized membrane protein YeiB